MSDSEKYVKVTLIFDMHYRGGNTPESLMHEIEIALVDFMPEPDVIRVKIGNVVQDVEENEDADL